MFPSVFWSDPTAGLKYDAGSQSFDTVAEALPSAPAQQIYSHEVGVQKSFSADERLGYHLR